MYIINMHTKNAYKIYDAVSKKTILYEFIHIQSNTFITSILLFRLNFK